MDSLHTLFLSFGINEIETEIYLYLAKNGASDVAGITKHLGLSRTTIHEALASLLVRDYLSYEKKGRQAFYSITDPEKLMSLLEEKKRQDKQLESEFREGISYLSGLARLQTDKPGIRFFEGEEGMKEALYDSLSAQGEIISFINSETVEAFGKDIDAQYVQERIKRNIQKRIILVDNSLGRAYAKNIDPQFTHIKFVSAEQYSFEGASEIYNDTVTHLMVSGGHITGILIRHPEIAREQRMLFEFLWNHLSSE